MSSLAEELRSTTKKAIERRLQIIEEDRQKAREEASPVHTAIWTRAASVANKEKTSLKILATELGVIGFNDLSDEAQQELIQMLREDDLKVEVGISTEYDGLMLGDIPRHDIEAYEEREALRDKHTKTYISFIAVSW